MPEKIKKFTLVGYTSRAGNYGIYKVIGEQMAKSDRSKRRVLLEGLGNSTHRFWVSKDKLEEVKTEK